MRTSSAKAKGRRLQDEVCLRLRVKKDWVSILNPDDIRPAIMGESGTDIKLSPAAKKIIPFDIECKNQEKWNIPEYWKQTKANTESGRIPLLVVKKNHHEPLVVISLDDFMGLI